jgi:hypothetical protein
MRMICEVGDPATPYYLDWLSDVAPFDRAFVINEPEGMGLAVAEQAVEAGLAEVAEQLPTPCDLVLVERSRERGTLSRTRKDALLQFCNAVGLPAHRLVYVSQNLHLAPQLNPHSHVWGHHYLWRMAMGFGEHSPDTAGFMAAASNGRALCLNNKIRAHRLAILNHVLRHDDISSHTTITWVGRDQLFDHESALDRARKDFPDFVTELSPRLKDYQQHIPSEDFSPELGSILGYPLRATAEAAIYFVPETEYAGSVRRFTEKAIKPIAAFRPFIVFGSPGVLAQLRDLGFRTFDAFWPEDYDAIENPQGRLATAFDALHQARAVIMAGPPDALLDVLHWNHQHLRERINPLMRQRFVTAINDVLAR